MNGKEILEEIKKNFNDFEVQEKVDGILKVLKEVGVYGWKLSFSVFGDCILAISDEDQRKWINENYPINFFKTEVDFAEIITKVEF